MVTLRYFSVYGPRQRPDMALARFLAAMLADERIEVFGDGRQSRDFTYVGDAVAATRAAARQGQVGAVYNVAGGHTVTVLEIVAALRSTSAVRSPSATCRWARANRGRPGPTSRPPRLPSGTGLPRR